jgi:hypothetical protein
MEPGRAMKPSFEGNGFQRETSFPECSGRFPFIDFNFQAFSCNRFYGGSSSGSQSSFLNISRDYFRYEARRNFLAEGAFFVALIAVLALTFVTGALTIIHFLQLPVE